MSFGRPLGFPERAQAPHPITDLYDVSSPANVSSPPNRPFCPVNGSPSPNEFNGAAGLVSGALSRAM